MDAMPLLRSCRDDLPEPDDARLAAMRARLETRMRAAPARVRRRGLVLAAAGCTVATAVVVGVVTAGPAPSASAEAARLLRGAAASAGSVGDGRTVVTHEQSLSMRLDADGEVAAAYVDRVVTTLHVPAGAGDWVRTRYHLEPATFYGGAAGRALAAEEAVSDATAADPVVERSADGDFTNGQLGGGSGFGDDPAALRALPHEPGALLAALRAADLGAGPRGGQAEHVLEAAAAVLRSGAADGALQAAVFGALQRQPGLDVTGAVDLDGRRGVAVGAAPAHGAADAQQLILDPASGAYLGDRDVALVDEGVVPAGAVLSQTAVRQG